MNITEDIEDLLASADRLLNRGGDPSEYVENGLIRIDPERFEGCSTTRDFLLEIVCIPRFRAVALACMQADPRAEYQSLLNHENGFSSD